MGFLFADPTPSLDQLTVIDQGSQLTVEWHFYYRLLPAKLTSRENNLPPLAFDDPATRRQNLTELASTAFALTLDGRPDPLKEISELTLAPDGGCFATLVYPGRRNGQVTLREAILPAYPPSYIINYEIYNPVDRARGASGYFTGGAPGPAVAYSQLASDAAPSAYDELSSVPVKLFKAELRTAWIDTNWLFAVLLIVLTRPPRELYHFAWIMALAAVLPQFFWVMDDAQVPNPLHPIVPGFCTALLGWLCVRRKPRFAGLACAVGAASLLYSCYDIQQTSLERPAALVSNLVGLCLGFAVGLALAFAVAYPIVAECRKYPGFQGGWAPKICWGLAIAALVLPWIRT